MFLSVYHADRQMEGVTDIGGETAGADFSPRAAVHAIVVASRTPSDRVSARRSSRKPPAYGPLGLRTDRTLPVRRPAQSP